MKRLTVALSLISLWLGANGCRTQKDEPQRPVPVATDGPAALEDQSSESRDPFLAQKIPVTPDVRVGKLPNGLTYYIRKHTQPKNRANLWLAVDAGSVQEDDDQQGLAHFVEHMAFNGTRRFKKMAIVNYLESIGMKFGPDINAYTSFDQTVYMLQLPTDDAKIMGTGFDILEDWAGGVAFEAEEVDKERGVVLEEWRLGRGASRRILDKQFPVLLEGSRYAKRLPIGKPDILEKAPRDALVRYYRDWYRPDLMAVVAVGDFDVDAIEKHIVEHFSGLSVPEKSRERVEAPLPGHPLTLVTVETDPEMPRTTVSVYKKLPKRPEGTVGDYRRHLAEQLYHQMLNARYSEIRQRPDSPFVFAFSAPTSYVRSADMLYQVAGVKGDAVEQALDALVTELARVDRHGFTESEFDRAKKQLAREYEKYAREVDKVDGRAYAAEIVRHHFTDEVMPGPAYEYELVAKLLPTFTLAELNHMAREWTQEANRVVMVSGPAKVEMPDRQKLLSVVQSAQERDVAAYEDRAKAEPLLATAPTPGKVVNKSEIPAIGTTVWQLDNGVKVVLKPTDFKNDEVLITGFQPGGHSVLGDDDFHSARHADSIAVAGGVGAFDAIELRKALAGKVVHVSPYIYELEQGVRGSASPDDLETLLQLVYLRFTAPRKDEQAFLAWKARTEERVENRRLQPERAFFEDMGSFLVQNHLRRQPVTLESLAKVDLDRALEIYRDRFANADGFTFVLVGNIDPAKLEPLVATYLGGLPSAKRKRGPKWKDVGVRRPRGVKSLTLEQGVEPKSFFYLTFHGAKKWSPDDENDIKMLSEVLRIRLREVLREDLGGVYSASVSGRITRRPRQEYSVTILFSCAPDNVDTLKNAVFAEIASIQKKGIGQEYIDKVKQIRTRTRETDLQKNSFWRGEFVHAYRYGDDPRRSILEFDELVERVSVKRIKAAARTYLRKKQYVVGVLTPENGAGK